MGGPASEMDSSIQEEFMILPEVPPSATQDILSEEPIYLRPVFYGAGSCTNKSTEVQKHESFEG
jgi:hypothetical protein